MTKNHTSARSLPTHTIDSITGRTVRLLTCHGGPGQIGFVQSAYGTSASVHTIDVQLVNGRIITDIAPEDVTVLS